MIHSHHESEKNSIPIVTIGLPVFNGENSIKASIESIINQSLQNWELIISDNNSNDQTVKVIEDIILNDRRIFLYKQKENIGHYANHDFVLKKSKGKYFHWLAADDTRSTNFLKENVSYLENNSDYIASCSIKYFGSTKKNQVNNINFKLEQETPEKRISFLLDNIWHSHAICWSVVRAEKFKNCQFLDEYYLARDWITNIFLAMNGKIALQKNSYIVLGESGVSKVDPFKSFRVFWIEYFIPLYSCHKTFNYISRNFNFAVKAQFQIKFIFLHITIIKINIKMYLKKIFNFNKTN